MELAHNDEHDHQGRCDQVNHHHAETVIDDNSEQNRCGCGDHAHHETAHVEIDTGGCKTGLCAHEHHHSAGQHIDQGPADRQKQVIIIERDDKQATHEQYNDHHHTGECCQMHHATAHEHIDTGHVHDAQCGHLTHSEARMHIDSIEHVRIDDVIRQNAITTELHEETSRSAQHETKAAAMTQETHVRMHDSTVKSPYDSSVDPHTATIDHSIFDAEALKPAATVTIEHVSDEITPKSGDSDVVRMEAQAEPLPNVSATADLLTAEVLPTIEDSFELGNGESAAFHLSVDHETLGTAEPVFDEGVGIDMELSNETIDGVTTDVEAPFIMGFDAAANVPDVLTMDTIVPSTRPETVGDTIKLVNEDGEASEASVMHAQALERIRNMVGIENIAIKPGQILQVLSDVLAEDLSQPLTPVERRTVTAIIENRDQTALLTYLERLFELRSFSAYLSDQKALQSASNLFDTSTQSIGAYILRILTAVRRQGLTVAA